MELSLCSSTCYGLLASRVQYDPQSHFYILLFCECFRHLMVFRVQSLSTRWSSFPYLFTLGLEGLSLMIKKADQIGNIDGVKIIPVAPSMVHLYLLMICSCFVMQIFLKYAWAKKECLEDFQIISCQRFIFPLFHHKCIWIFSKILHMKSLHLPWGPFGVGKKTFHIYAWW